MKIFSAGLATETNTFAPFPTGEMAFEESGIFRGTVSEGGSWQSAIFRTWKDAATAAGCDFSEGFVSFAQPGGSTPRHVYEAYRDEILADMCSRGPFDVVLLGLHGAMVADGYVDCEGDLIEKVRGNCPSSTVIGVELDPHCHLTHRMCEHADVLIAAKEYPHVDFADRAAELIDICLRTRRGEVRPVKSVFDCRMVGWFPTTAEPMTGLVAKARECERLQGVLSASIVHGFPWADVPEMGAKVLVITDGDPTLAESQAEDLGRAFYAQRNALLPKFPQMEEALDLALASTGRVVIADVGDNAGGGAASDNTTLLRAMLRRGIRDAACGLFWDPVAARISADAGVGARLSLRLGGKVGPMSSDPLDVEVSVRGVKHDHCQSRFAGGAYPLGLSVWVSIAGIDVVISSIRMQVLTPSAFTGLGIDLHSRRLICVKSAQHFFSAFSPIADHVIYAATPGAMDMAFQELPYRRVERTFHPRLPDPLGLDIPG